MTIGWCCHAFSLVLVLSVVAFSEEYFFYISNDTEVKLSSHLQSRGKLFNHENNTQCVVKKSPANPP